MRQFLFKRSYFLTAVVLTAIFALFWSVPQQARAAGNTPHVVVISGYIYDFKSSHPDFGLSPGSGYEVAGLVDPEIGFNGKPWYFGMGSALSTQALDGDTEPLAPHLFWQYGGSGALTLATAPVKTGAANIDIYDPSKPYGGTNVGPAPVVTPGATMPTIDVPTGLPYVDAIDYDGNATSTLNKSWECKTFRVRNNHVLTISGDVVLVVTDQFRMINYAEIQFEPGATLTVYLGGAVSIENFAKVNTAPMDHSAMTFYNYGTQTFFIDNNVTVAAVFVCPNSELNLKNSCEVFGNVIAKSLELNNNCDLHIADSVWDPSACYTQNDSQAPAGSPSTGQISGALSLAQWFNSAPGVNLFQTHQMFLGDTGSEYVSYASDWDPINGELYGNEGDTGNRGFAFAGQSLFEYTACGGEYFEVETGMDCWVFIDDELVIDLGGNTGRSRQRILLDRLVGLGPGLHTLRLFIAHRQNTAMDLKVTTTVPLTPPRVVTAHMSNLHD